MYYFWSFGLNFRELSVYEIFFCSYMLPLGREGGVCCSLSHRGAGIFTYKKNAKNF